MAFLGMSWWNSPLLRASNIGTQGLTYWDRNKIVPIFQMTFSMAFSWMNMYEFRLSCHWSLVPKVQFTTFQHWVISWRGAEQATIHYLYQMRPSLLAHMCLTWSQWCKLQNQWYMFYPRHFSAQCASFYLFFCYVMLFKKILTIYLKSYCICVIVATGRHQNIFTDAKFINCQSCSEV